MKYTTWTKKQIREHERKEAFNGALIEWALYAVIFFCILSLVV